MLAMPEPWLTKKELAEALKVSIRTIERVKPPCLLVGGQNRYRMSEVEKALRSMPVASDRIEVVLTLTPDEYRELGQNLQKIRDRLGRSPAESNTQLLLESAAHLAEHGTTADGIAQ
jgi:hypothetical protein